MYLEKINIKFYYEVGDVEREANQTTKLDENFVFDAKVWAIIVDIKLELWSFWRHLERIAQLRKWTVMVGKWTEKSFEKTQFSFSTENWFFFFYQSRWSLRKAVNALASKSDSNEKRNVIEIESK